MISIIVCSRDDSRFDPFFTRISRVFAGTEFELIRIPDARGMAEGYNRGFAASSGEILVFCHDDIELIGEDVPGRLASHLGRWDGIGLAGTDLLVSPRWLDAGPPHIFGQVAYPVEGGYRVCLYAVPARSVGGIQGLDGLFIAFRRGVIEKVGWDEIAFTGFHGYDIDTSYRAHRMGFKLAVVNDLPAIHASGGSFGEAWKESARNFVAKHPEVVAPEARQWSLGTVSVRTKIEALDVMTPRYLGDV